MPLARVAADGRPVVPLLFYRSMLLAADVAPIEALSAALAERGVAGGADLRCQPARSGGGGLRRGRCLGARAGCARHRRPRSPAARSPARRSSTGSGVPVFQVMPATTRREAWAGGPRGLAPADLAMHVVLPELDGRILAGRCLVQGSRGRRRRSATALANRPEPDRVDAGRRRGSRRSCGCRRRRAAERRLAILMPDYPARAGAHRLCGRARRAGERARHAARPEEAGYRGRRDSGNAAGAAATFWRVARRRWPLADYRAGRCRPGRWPRSRPRGGGMRGGRRKARRTASFRFRAARFGNVTVALAPDRGRARATAAPTITTRRCRRAMRCSPSASGCGRRSACHALVHVGAHGTLEWLPGKTVALSDGLLSRNRRRRAAGHLSLHRQQPRRGGAGQAAHRRRDARPPAAAARRAGLDEDRAEARAAGRRICAGRRARPPAPRPAGEADRRDGGERTGLAAEAGVGGTDEPDEALRRIDAWLCDLKDFAIKDGLHVFGRAQATPTGRGSAEAERQALLAALDGRHVAAGPVRRAGARPHRRAADRPQPLHRRPAHHADADRLRTRQAAADEVLRRYHAGARRLAALAGDRPLGQRQPAHRRRGDRARAGADGLPAAMGRGDRPRHRRSRCCRRRCSAGRAST